MEETGERSVESRGGTFLLRLGATAGLLSIAGLFTLALAVEPDPSGMGTHQRFGLPPCTFFVITGFPCPTCGVTTAFAHMIRFEVLDAISAQPFGAALFLVALLSFAWCIATIIYGRKPSDWLASKGFDPQRWLLAGVGFGLLSWFYKILMVVGMD